MPDLFSNFLGVAFVLAAIAAVAYPFIAVVRSGYPGFLVLIAVAGAIFIGGRWSGHDVTEPLIAWLTVSLIVAVAVVGRDLRLRPPPGP